MQVFMFNHEAMVISDNGQMCVSIDGFFPVLDGHQPKVTPVCHKCNERYTPMSLSDFLTRFEAGQLGHTTCPKCDAAQACHTCNGCANGVA